MIEHNKQVAEQLSKLLAESYTLYLKTHKYHWNVTGPMFHSLHLLFEQQYTELAQDHRTVAEQANRVLKLAGEHEDEGSSTVASDRIEIHEKAAWMLSAHLD